ncbi:MAG: glycosyltransferase [Muribaculaceae bacterium]|nr:glycosyltransferase [Muribaculaceae bacterium]
MKFSLIVPVYNRPDEVADLLQSLDCQSNRDFELILVEDGSTIPCSRQAGNYIDRFPIRYFEKPNEGRSIARNYGMQHASGEYFVFVDSDCILPPDYFLKLSDALEEDYADCFGGPDAAHQSFTDTQKAINFAMTAFLTTGGIRGGKVSMEKFVPRTFNMGFSRQVWNKVGGFREMFSEDIDMSTRIRKAGFNPRLYRDVKVFHKRRGNLAKFWRQVHVFGMSRITLQLLYPGSMKIVHWMPALFTLGSAILILLGILLSPLWLIPLGLYLMALWISAITATRSLKIGTMAVAASLVQLYGYGTGFLRAYIWKILLHHGRDEAQEIAMRKGK